MSVMAGVPVTAAVRAFWAKGIHPSPWRTTRRRAARLVPPIPRGGWWVWRGDGSIT